jgi:hypothetical protein
LKILPISKDLKAQKSLLSAKSKIAPIWSLYVKAIKAK